jgi:hypothetical protein
MRKLVLDAVLILGLAVAPVVSVASVAGATPSPQALAVAMPTKVVYKFKNCKALNNVYPHGVGKATAYDHTSGDPVTDFKKSTALYKKIIGHRKSLDRDHDGIACERA